MIINHNITALKTYGQLSSANTAQSKSMEKLSSGQRINSAADDAAGLAISEKMRAQVRGLDMASKNAQDGVSLLQTAEGSLNETHDILQRMRELAVQSSNDTNTDDDRNELQKEVTQLAEEITRIGKNSEFNTKNLIDGSFSGKFQIGANEDQNIQIDISDMTAATLKVGTESDVSYTAATVDDAKVLKSGDDVVGTWQEAQEATEGKEAVGVVGEEGYEAPVVAKDATVAGYYKDNKLVYQADKALDDEAVTKEGTTGIDISSQESANKAITTINEAIKTVSGERSKIGAYQNRLEHSINNLNTSSENLTAAESRIRDVDMAKEMMEQTKNSILSQAAQAMLAQANQQPQNVLQLLR